MGGFPHFFKLSTVPLSSGANECELNILTTLASPNPDTVKTLKSGDILSISVNASTNGLEVFSSDGRTCGNIISSVSRIKNCLAKGHSFEAKVIVLNGAECQVLIQNSTNG